MIMAGSGREADSALAPATQEGSDRWVRALTLLTIVATLLLTISVARDDLSFGPVGAISSFSIPYFIALASFAAIAIAASERAPALALYNLLLIAVALWLVPTVVGASAPLVVHQFEMYGNINSIVETGELDPERLLFHSWPAWAIIGATLTNIAGRDVAEPIIQLAPFFVQVSVILAIAMLSNAAPESDGLGRRGWILVALLVSAANWTHVNAFLPQGAAYVLLMILVAFIGKRWIAGRPLGTAGVATSYILIVGIVVTHLPTSLAMLTTLAAIAFLLRRADEPRAALYLGAMVLAGAWAIYWSGAFLDRNLAGYVDVLSRITESMQEGARQSVEPGAFGGDYGRIARLRLLSVAVLATLAVGGLAAWALSRNRDRGGLFLASVGLGFASVSFIVAGGLTASYTLRIYTFLLLPAAYFAARLARFRVGLVAILIAVAIGLPGHLVLQEGFQRWEHMDRSYLVGLEYFHEYTDRGTVAELKSAKYGDPYAFGAYKNRTNYNHISQPEADPLVLSALALPGAVPEPLYFIETSRAEQVFRDVLADPEAFEEAVDWIRDSKAALTYDNGEVRIWPVD